MTGTTNPAGDPVDVVARLAALRALYVEAAAEPGDTPEWLLAELGRLTSVADVEYLVAVIRLADPTGALWRAVDRLAGLLGMTWSVDDHGAAVLAAAADRLAGLPPPPPGGYGWERYRRTCDPDQPIDGAGDLCAFLGGTWADSSPGAASATAVLLWLIAKVQSDPDKLARLEVAFPREVAAWRTWMSMPSAPTAAELAAELTARQNGAPA